MLGKLRDFDGEFLAHSIELPWRDNTPNISCIPTGTYKCLWTYSPRFKREMYILQGVEGRSGIRIHKGSYAGATDYGYRADFLGCISFGRGYAQIGKQILLHTTTVTISRLEEKLNREDFTLNIIGEFSPIK